MSASNANGSRPCSTVPSVGDGTLEHGQEKWNSAGTPAEQTNLQALALKALQRNTSGTNVFQPAEKTGSDIPSLFRVRMPVSRHSLAT